MSAGKFPRQEMAKRAGARLPAIAGGCYLQRFAAGVQKPGESFSWLDGQAVERITGSRFYRAALHWPGPALFHPLLLVRGLAWSLSGNAALYEESEVVGVELGP